MRKLTKKEEKENRIKYRKPHLDKVGNNIFEHIHQINEMEKARSDYFHWCSDLKHAIEDHISESKSCVLIDREGDSIVNHRGSGASILIRNINYRKYYWEDGKQVLNKYFTMDVGVEYYTEDSAYHDPLYGDTYKKTYYGIKIPIDLELNFTQTKFNYWIKKLRVERNKEKVAENEKELKRLRKETTSLKKETMNIKRTSRK